MMRVTYFASDLTDPTFVKRMAALRIGGADVRLLGFRRSAASVREVEGFSAIDLGRTFNGRLGLRCLQIARQSVRDWRDVLAGSDVLLAKNLEMATMADVARARAALDIPLAYECLDIHPAVVGEGATGRVLRSWERRILRRSAMLVVSSPGFVSNYFGHLGIHLPELILAENKLVLSQGQTESERPQYDAAGRGPPWRIGWCGVLRCAESFKILMNLAQRLPELVDIELRGRPVEELATLIGRHLPIANMRFAGAYTLSDLASVYAGCDLTWGVELLHRDHNSRWHLPNRIYEGGYYNSPVIAHAGTEIAAWLNARGTGVLLGDPYTDLEPFIAGLTTSAYDTLRRSAANVPTNDLVWSAEDCRRLTHRLTGKHQPATFDDADPAILLT